MKTSIAIGLFMAVALTAGVAEPTNYQRGPKNLVSPTYRGPVVTATPHEFNGRDAQKLAAIAESAADHLKLARYYGIKANELYAKGAAYEQTAATYRNGPFVKNLMAPGTPARFEYVAKLAREEAASSRALSESHEQMAKDASAHRGLAGQ